MVGYLEVGAEIARRVRSGDLGPGAVLSSVRAQARERETTASTISRAYRYLAEAGVIILADRRRARVAPEGAIAAARLLEVARVFRLAGSDDPALQIVLAHAGGTVVTVCPRTSFQGLRALVRGDADGAAVHLRHRCGVYNAPSAVALLRGRGPVLLHLWRREQGLLVAPGNPGGVTGPADLAGLRVAKREVGAGTRVLLDQLLTSAGIAPDDVAGPELGSHLEIALAVASGIADVGLGVRAAANGLGLDFIAVAWECYDIALAEDALGAARPLITALRDPAVRASIIALGGYDLAWAGTVESLTGAATGSRSI
ncbi:MAG TPA: helix-turn-helix transcriptional regulator [Pseudonocardiaceae bacterium]|nr:helix-turn-helix transcriptional regulator [Pseudonocardiaceae bacterium]